jgi:hypothetical protein
MKLLTCSFCEYKTNRAYNLKRHQNSKHIEDMINPELVQNVPPNVQNVPPKIQNVPPNVQNVPPSVQNVPSGLKCKFCNKKYETERHLLNHEKKCNKVDSLTCPRCMISFTNRKHKSRHIKANKCEARSIMYARTPNVQNITTQNNTNNNTNNNTHNEVSIADSVVNSNNTFIINNYGSERIDYLSEEDMFKILTSGENTIPLYIEKKHFNKDFPENQNIKYDSKTKRCKIREDDKWNNMDLSMVSTKLIKDNSNTLLTYFNSNKDMMYTKIHDDEVFDYILNKLITIKHKTDREKYNTMFNIIKYLLEKS